ncbi:esterase-like activity of phytase family protein [Pararhodobacter sp.]|uniref:esterase-like activity of phytase family protein n=1 Tax=Pararhodobacter sp. TaxID=2127056 RepID=UPI002FDD9E0B
MKIWRAILMALAISAAPALAQDAAAPAPPPPAPQVLSQLFWQASDARLQRFTGIDTDDGVAVIMVTDEGVLAQGRLERAGDGRITGVQPQQIRYLRDPDGAPLTGPRRNAQAVALGDGGRIFVAFQGYGRVLAYAAPDASATQLAGHPDFARLTVGAGLTGLAVSRSGVLYAIPERAARMTYGTPSYHFWNGEWAGSFRLPADGQFHPVGADIGPDGRLYILERERAAEGRRVQLRRFILQGSRIDAGTVVMRSAFGQFSDLSGVSVWGRGNGPLRALMTGYARGPGARSEIVELFLPR